MKRQTNFSGGAKRIGSLYDDLSSLAGHVQQSLCDGPVTVWTDDECGVFLCEAAFTPTLPSHWLAGTYSLGHPHQAIQDDLRLLLRERAKDCIDSRDDVGATA